MVRSGIHIGVMGVLAVWSGVAADASGAGADLPDDIVEAIVADLGTSDPEQVRYVADQFDLDGDGKPEQLVYLVGLATCGTGGCTLQIFTPGEVGYRRVADLSLIKTPILVAPSSSGGWRDLVVHLGGGGMQSRDVLLRFDAAPYTQETFGDPTADVTPEVLEHSIPLFEGFSSWSEARPLVPEDPPRGP